MFFVLLVVFVNFSSQVWSDGLPWEQRLPFENGVIRYSISGLETGTETIYIRDWGQTRATYHESKATMVGVTMQTREIEIKTPEYIYSFDLEGNKGFKAQNPQKIMAEEYSLLSASEQEEIQENARKMRAAYAEGMGGRVQENAEIILGYSCDKVNIMNGSTTYLIHGTDIPLKTEMNMMGAGVIVVATAIETGPVDDSYFQLPEGIVAETDPEADAMAAQMARQAIAMLKDTAAVGDKSDALTEKSTSPEHSGAKRGEKAMQEILEGLKEGGR